MGDHPTRRAGRWRSVPDVPAIADSADPRPLDEKRAVVPDIHAIPGPGPERLEWRVGTEREGRSLDGLLTAFVKLHDADLDQIATFAQEWGVLGGCEHGHAGERQRCSPLDASDRYWREQAGPSPSKGAVAPTDDDPGLHWELASAWGYWARRFRATLSLAVDLRAGQEGRFSDWAEVAISVPLETSLPDWDAMFRRSAQTAFTSEAVLLVLVGPKDDPNRPLVDIQQEHLIRLVDDLILDAHLRPTAVGHEPGWTRLGLELADPVALGNLDAQRRWDPRCDGLFAPLVLQLVAALTSPLGLFRCDRCGTPSPPLASRRARGDRQRFCSEACRLDARREANRESERRRAARRRA
ncbi:MAG: hypothetical protein M3Q03_04070 [Chloroflexota bacterium]|nr:hypothetical protein [Chloroflexota bacterium]